MKRARDINRRSHSKKPRPSTLPDDAGETATPAAADAGLPPLDARDDRVPMFAVPIDAETGRVAWDKVKGKKRERLRVIVNDPSFASEIGLHVDPTKPAEPATTPETAAMLYSGLSMLLSGMMQIRGVAPEHAALMCYRPDQVKVLAPLTATVMNRWIGPVAYSDEIMLILALGMMTTANMTAMREAIVAAERAARPSPQAPLPFTYPTEAAPPA